MQRHELASLITASHIATAKEHSGGLAVRMFVPVLSSWQGRPDWASDWQDSADRICSAVPHRCPSSKQLPSYFCPKDATVRSCQPLGLRCFSMLVGWKESNLGCDWFFWEVYPLDFIDMALILIVSDLKILTSVKFGGMAACLNQLNWPKRGMGSARKVGLQRELNYSGIAAKNGDAFALHTLSLILHFILERLGR